jgi:uncharacterized protein
MVEIIVINSGPLISFARMDAFQVISQLPFKFVTPREVHTEILSGTNDRLATSFPSTVEVLELASTHNTNLFENLDSGEAAVIQLALENSVTIVCLDERKARRIAVQNGLMPLGTLGLLGRAKTLGIIGEINPFIAKALEAGVYYDLKLVKGFLERFDEQWSY